MSFLQNSPYVDTLVLNALRNDDEAALNYLFTTYYNKLFRTGLKLGASSQTIEEAIQSVFVDIWQYRKTLGEVQSFEAYLSSKKYKEFLTQFQHDNEYLILIDKAAKNFIDYYSC